MTDLYLERQIGNGEFPNLKGPQRYRLMADRIADECLQFHGGMGYMDETFISRVWRDQRLLRIGAGTSEVMRYYIAKMMGF